MKNKEIAVLAKRLRLDLSGFAVKAPFVFQEPIGHTLRGLCFESHSYEARLFYLWVFAIPLFVPTKYIHYSFGFRLEASTGGPWDSTDPNVIAALNHEVEHRAIAFLKPFASPRGFTSAEIVLQRSHDRYVLEAIAYSFARIGEVAEAVLRLDQLIPLLDRAVHWQLAMFERAQTLKFLLEHDPPQVKNQLDEWEAESVRNLGLTKFLIHAQP